MPRYPARQRRTEPDAWSRRCGRSAKKKARRRRSSRIAWVRSRGADIVPRDRRPPPRPTRGSARRADLKLDAADLARIDAAVSPEPDRRRPATTRRRWRISTAKRILEFDGSRGKRCLADARAGGLAAGAGGGRTALSHRRSRAGGLISTTSFIRCRPAARSPWRHLGLRASVRVQRRRRPQRADPPHRAIRLRQPGRRTKPIRRRRYRARLQISFHRRGQAAAPADGRRLSARRIADRQ